MTDRHEVQSTANSNSPTRLSSDNRCWWLRRICSQNPFYLLSVCFVLHGVSRWYHVDTGTAFSPWPLMVLTSGYIIVLALTGFVIVRFGNVWDDARSILLIILLMFVELSLIFDDSLVNNPWNGFRLLLTCWAFATVLSEMLLLGLGIRLPWRYRLPYHGLIALLFLYPISLVPLNGPIPVETVQWRIFLFPTAAAAVFLTLIPAIRRGRSDVKENGTPWYWPWFPWSLFVFLGVCICFRAYALTLSFDPVLGESLKSAMSFSSAFGVYFLVPLVLAVSALLLEIGITERHRGVMRLALLCPAIAFGISIPSLFASGPYHLFLRMLTSQIGSPIWLTTIAITIFYGLAFVRRVPSAEPFFMVAALALTRLGPNTIDIMTIAPLQWWPAAVLAVIQLCIGLLRRESLRVFIASLCCLAALQIRFDQVQLESNYRIAFDCLFVTASVLLTGALFRDEFAWLLRLVGVPLLIAMTVVGCLMIRLDEAKFPIWTIPLLMVVSIATSSLYAAIVRMPIYHIASLTSLFVGTIFSVELMASYLIRESPWYGTRSFLTGIASFAVAFLISACKAGWLKNVYRWIRSVIGEPLLNST